MHKKVKIHVLELLIESCEEGKDGRWDCSTAEGKEGFDDMIVLLNTIFAPFSFPSTMYLL